MLIKTNTKTVKLITTEVQWIIQAYPIVVLIFRLFPPIACTCTGLETQDDEWVRVREMKHCSLYMAYLFYCNCFVLPGGYEQYMYTTICKAHTKLDKCKVTVVMNLHQ